MKKLSKKTKQIIFLVLVIISSSCTKNNNYHISGNVIMATTGEPIEGVQVEVYNKVCDFGVPCWHEDSHFVTTNSNGGFEMVFMSKETQMEKIFSKQYLHIFNSGNNRFVTPGSSSFNNISMYSQTEDFIIEFEPILPNVQEVTIELEWNRFSENNTKITLGPFEPLFEIEKGAYLSQYSPPKQYNIHIGEQWLKMNFDILLEDGSRLQKTDSIWLPSRYYDFNDYDFGDPRKYPVYKFTY